MSNDNAEGGEPRHDPLAALRQRNFQIYSGSRIFGSLSQQMLQAVMAWQVYDLSGNALSLGLLGLARFFPALAASLIGGTVADIYDRRKVILVMQLVPLGCAITLAVATSGGWVTEALIYGLVVCIGVASAFEAPARTALLPAIVKPETFVNAVTVNNIFQKVGSISGPAIGGLLIAFAGITTAYSVFCVTMLMAALPLLALRYVDTGQSSRKVSIAAIKEGIVFVRDRQVLLGAMTLDMFAVTFGGAQALLPIYAKDILDAGAIGFGALNSALQVGGFVTSFALVMLPPVKRTGRALVVTVIIFGLLTVAFGLSRNIYLSVVLYGLIGVADQISVVMRQTTIQMATPNELRGRVSSVHQVFVQASNQIGAMESGFVAAATTATFAVVSGGFAAAAIAAAIGRRLPQLWNYEMKPGMPVDELDPTAKKRADPLTTAGS